MSKALNLYGDRGKFLADGHGADIASQRADDLDRMALDAIKSGKFAIDVACGAGGQSFRLSRMGAWVLALDIVDMSSSFKGVISEPGRVRFYQYDMRNLEDLQALFMADVIMCQRAIHYFPYSEAVNIVQSMYSLLGKGGQLFISASGIHSELGDDYVVRDSLIGSRFGPLSQKMIDKHNICGNVCLYSEDDLTKLLEVTGFKVEKVFSSSFGNIKGVGRRV